MKIRSVNYHGFDHEAVARKFGGDLTFVNSFTVKAVEFEPVAVYLARSPDRAKGHKTYMLLQVFPGRGGIVRGMELEDFKGLNVREAIHCLDCDEVIFSSYRHDCAWCTCGNAMIDGGHDYVRSGGKDLTRTRSCRLDLLTGKVEYGQANEENQNRVEQRGPSEGTPEPAQVQLLPPEPRRKRKAKTQARKNKAAA